MLTEKELKNIKPVFNTILIITEELLFLSSRLSTFSQG
jgi:hypothetical protein